MVFLLYALKVNAQSTVEEFRNFENRVKYKHPDSLFVFAEQFDTTNLKQAAYHFWAVGRGHYWLGAYPESYMALEKAANYTETSPIAIIKAEIYLDLSASLSIMEQTGKALSFLLEAKNLFNKLGNNEQKARAGIALGELYRKISEFDQALATLRASLPQARKQDKTMAMCYNRLAAVFSETGLQDSSLHYSNMALLISKKLNDPALIATSENEIGYIYLTQGNFDDALPHFYNALNLWKSAGLLRYAIHAMHHISVSYGSTNRFKQSMDITQEAYSLVRNKQWHQIEAKLLEDLRNLHYQLGRLDSGDYYERKRLESIVLWKDQQYSMNTKMVGALYAQNQNEELIKRQQLELENQLQLEKRINSERLNLMIISVFLFLFALALGYIAYLQQKKRKSSLKNQAIIEAQKADLEKALFENQALLQELHHRIKNNLQQISTLIDMQRRTVSDVGGKAALSDAQRRIGAMGMVHEMLYSYDNLATISIADFLTTLVNGIKALHEQKEMVPVNFELTLGTETLKTPDAISLGMIVSEAVSNSIKHRRSDAKTDVAIELHTAQNNSSIQVLIADNNAGRTDDLNTKKDERLGIRLMEIFTQKLNGTLNFAQGKEGLIVEITFPKS